MYWVTDSVTGKWIDLPDITPPVILLARQIKHIFTGDLEADVISNPFFPWKEKMLLRAQIARITQSTTLTPDGIWKKAEDNPREITERPEEEKKFPTFEKLTKLDAWCHLVPGILQVY
jgi:radial spoke head protein 4A